MAESGKVKESEVAQEELKNLLIEGKRESEKVGLILNIQKPKIMASSPITSCPRSRGCAGAGGPRGANPR